MTDKHGSPISIVVDETVGSTNANSLAVRTAALIDSNHKRELLEADFVMSRIDVWCTLKFGNDGAESGVFDNQGGFLVLAQGIADVADIGAAMTGALNFDQTPAEGDDPARALDAKQKIPILIIPLELKVVVHDQPADVIRSFFSASYHGSPLRQGGSWTFPKDQGWQWAIYNYTNANYPASTIVDLWARHFGVARGDRR